MLFNHNENRVLARQNDNSLELKEDNIGLKAKATIRDLDVIDEAKKGHLTGWSFGFSCLEDSWEDEKRSIKSLYLYEVSLLNVEPAYMGTSVEVRSSEETPTKVEIRWDSELQIEKEEVKEEKINIQETREYKELEEFLKKQCLLS